MKPSRSTKMKEQSNTNNIPHQSLPQIFLRFLRFGLLAWGGPVPQIAMLHQEIVEENKWISGERFNRVLAVYQALPGPEAHEMCVYFGMITRGRVGGFLAGLGFMLPGFILMFILSWIYMRYGINSPFFAAIFFGCKPAVSALIIRAVHRIGKHALADHQLWVIAIVSGIASLLGTHFLIILVLGGVCHFLLKRRFLIPALFLGILLLSASVAFHLSIRGVGMTAAVAASTIPSEPPSLLRLLYSGIRSGLLTFGGAYTVIPFLQHDAVEVGRWMTNRQFLDGLALSGILPAPLVIFSTFVGYLGRGPLGAIALTAGIFAPAFLVTLVGHRYLERIIENKALSVFNDGVAAGVVGLISATTIGLLRAGIPNIWALGIFLFSLLTLYQWKSRFAVPALVLGAGTIGLVARVFLPH